jgi:hypothetical protein
MTRSLPLPSSNAFVLAASTLLASVAASPLLAGTDYPVVPVPFTDVRAEDEFWAKRIETNRTVSIPYAFGKCEETGRIANFELAAKRLRGEQTGEHRGDYPFDDTDPYKVLEGASYALAVEKDPKLDAYVDDLIAKIAAAQEEDGYLYTVRTNGAKRLEGWFGPERWSNLDRSHELYNAGHLYEAAVAHYRATGKRSLLEVATKSAELLVRTFGPGKLELPPGHQIIEMGLAKLYRATGERKYLDLAKFFLDVRGRETGGRKLYGPYSQDHAPVPEQAEAVGHAVRAAYMYAGMADIAALTGDAAYATAAVRIWENVVSKKLYITGGIGATGSGEAFGGNYELPNRSAYCETCAQIGNVYWNHRLFLLTGEGRFVDVLERTLYNAGISGVSLEGKLFFYPNPLESWGEHERSPWFGCACCPGNVTRFIASVPGYIYASVGDALYVNLYVAGKGVVSLDGGKVEIRQETRYPWDGAVALTLRPEKPRELSVLLRIPGWAREEPVPSDLYRFLGKGEGTVTLRCNGEEVPVAVERGFAKVRRVWKAGDTVRLDLPMPIRRVVAHEKVDDDRGKVAVERGPIVFCAEHPDNREGRVLSLLLPDASELSTEFRADLLGGVQTVRGKAVGLRHLSDGKGLARSDETVTLVPYYAWAHRGRGEMAVWLAREESAARPLAAPTIASRSRASASGGRGIEAVNDQAEPRSSGDHSVPFFHWWPRKGTTEWIQYDFEKPEEVATAEVYWFDDTGAGECRVPKAWKVLYRKDGQWAPVYTTDPYGVAKDAFNVVTFEAVKTDALRLEIELLDGVSTGIHEWKVR